MTRIKPVRSIWFLNCKHLFVYTIKCMCVSIRNSRKSRKEPLKWNLNVRRRRSADWKKECLRLHTGYSAHKLVFFFVTTTPVSRPINLFLTAFLAGGNQCQTQERERDKTKRSMEVQMFSFVWTFIFSCVLFFPDSYVRFFFFFVFISHK